MLARTHVHQRAFQAHNSSSKHASSRLACRAVAAPAKVELKAAGTTQGVEFAPLINGCWQLAGGHGREVFDGLEDKLRAHAEAGFTTFDTADIYGPSEGILGQFSSSWKDAGKQPLQVFTKYVPNIFNSRPSPASVEAAIKKSLSNLQVEQLDLVQMHWWDYNIGGMVDAAKCLADLQAKGLIKQVGLTNMDVAAVSKIVDAGVPVANNQVQFSLLDRRPLNGMLEYCQAHGIKLMSYGSVAGGLLSDRYVEEPKKGLFGQAKFSPVDLNTSSLKMYWGVAKQFGGQELWRELLQVLHQVAQKHNVSVANVALRWVMQQGDAHTVFPIVGMRSAVHIQDNVRVLSLQLDAADLAAIDEVLAKATGPAGDIYSFERGN
uniref:NADP-dependent oxidoreductase domain-containing protein n=1 Tax=Tetradesmus obliquus TaxID=3088 RepID=A0A383V713_TETOB|eukprot:jgi/Sobl393_1/348/SZX60136.1